MTDKPRVRFAPSPTGMMHIGNIRTGLFNWLYARHHGGTFILRIEDTDRERSTPESVRVIVDSMEWLGLDFDEGPYFPSERPEFYRRHLDELLAAGKAYRCRCSPEVLKAKRERARAEKRPEGYDRTCRGADVSPDEPHTVRAALPTAGKTVVHDLLRGDVVFDNAELDDLIIARTDGSPTYNFVVVVDDADMAITHVIRGDDHLSNTPKQVALYELMGKPVPEFAHLSMILGEDGSKLSKRHGAVSTLQFRDEGYLPDVMVSFLARLGWSHGDQEEFTREELIRLFDLDAVRTVAAVFDRGKLDHFNGRAIRAFAPAALREAVTPFLVARGFDAEAAWLDRGLEAVRERANTLVELTEALAPFYAEEPVFDEKARRKNLKPGRVERLPDLAGALAGVEPWTADALEAAAEAWLAANDLALKKVGQPIRVAITGRAVSPPLFDTMEVLGREKVLKRLKDAPRIADETAGA